MAECKSLDQFKQNVGKKILTDIAVRKLEHESLCGKVSSSRRSTYDVVDFTGRLSDWDSSILEKPIQNNNRNVSFPGISLKDVVLECHCLFYYSLLGNSFGFSFRSPFRHIPPQLLSAAMFSQVACFALIRTVQGKFALASAQWSYIPRIRPGR